jgi:cobalt-zinc-cadmium efflux system outer membrane protein
MFELVTHMCQRTPVCARATVLAFMVGLIGAVPVSGQQALTLEQVYARLQENNSQLAAARALAHATAARQPGATVPADPSVQLGVMNLSLPSLRANMPTSMAPSIQLMQMIALPGKLSLAGSIAEKSSEAARTQSNEVWWELRAQAAMAFYELYSLDGQLEVMNSTLKLLQDFQGVAKAMYGSGTGRQSDVLRANVETAKMQADILRMRAMRAAAAARLNALLGRPADTPVERVAVGELTLALPTHDTLRAWAETSRPMLIRARTLIEQAELQRDLAGKELWPDFNVGFAYGQRSAEMGTERMGSLMVGFTVPVFAAQRQMRMRDEAGAMETMARAELSGMRAQVDARLGELLAALALNTSLIDLYRTNIIPQADANVQSALSAYRVGSVDFMTLVDAQMIVNRYRQELHALVSEYGSALAELEMTVGRAIAPTTRVQVEES